MPGGRPRKEYPDGMKTCGSCAQRKPLTEFPLNERQRPKYQCKVCAVQKQKEWRRSKPDYERTRYQAIKVETRERHLVRKYGVDLKTYDEMLLDQGGRCAICHCTPDTQSHGVFHVDHCHGTGRVRGLLCRGCNHVLGHLKDDPKALRRAIAYLVPQIPELIGKAILEAEGLTP